jgi:hypothetical protein
MSVFLIARPCQAEVFKISRQSASPFLVQNPEKGMSGSLVVNSAFGPPASRRSQGKGEPAQVAFKSFRHPADLRTGERSRSASISLFQQFTMRARTVRAFDIIFV